MKKLIATLLVTGLLLFLLVASLFLRIERSPVENLEEATMRLTFEGEFSVNSVSDGNGEPRITWAAVQSLNYPEESKYLEIIDFGASEPYVVGEDEFGNHYVVLNFSNPVFGINKYKIWTTVRTSKITVADITTSLDSIHQDFMNSNPMTQSDDPLVKNTAVAATQESISQSEKVKHVSEWVFNNIEYDLALEHETLDAVWTLQNQRGVCVEMSHTAEAMLKSLDIPARHVYGAAPYNFPSGWQEHTWVEAYIGKWIPLDPTWDETEYLDPAHVTFARVPDQTFVEEKVSVSGRNIKMGEMVLPVMTVEILNEKRGKEPIYVKLFGKKFKIR
jgi:hypothetical protein|tara:strand:+ start:36445 stop:37440 length:996 start_codon:yes stop_codon:yes gene_type:complete